MCLLKQENEMKAAETNQASVKGEKRYIKTNRDDYELCECTMMLGMAFNSLTGQQYQECLWRMPNGRSIQGSAHENWLA